MQNENKVLACVDQSHYADYVGDYAAWAACRMSAPLEFLHIISQESGVSRSTDHSGAIGIDAQELLLDQLAAEDAARVAEAKERGRVFLNRLRERALEAGAPSVDVRQRRGDLVETMTEQEAGVRLHVIGRRGVAAEATQKDLGRNVERVVRALKKPILTVTEGFHEPNRIMIAFDGGNMTRRGVKMVARSPLFRGLPIYVLMSGSESKDVSKQLAWATSTLQEGGFQVEAVHKPGDAEDVIAASVAELEIDLLIMGAYSHSPLRSLFFGSKTTDLLRSSKVPTLLVR